jgi:hypothetical protein
MAQKGPVPAPLPAQDSPLEEQISISALTIITVAYSRGKAE